MADNATVGSGQDRALQLVRVKRRRDATAADQLILHELALGHDDGKRRRTQESGNAPAVLAKELSQGLNLSDAAAPTSSSPEQPTPQQQSGVTRRRRYIRVETMDPAKLQGLGPAELAQMVNRWKQAAKTAHHSTQLMSQDSAGAAPGSQAPPSAPLQYRAVRGKRTLSSLLQAGAGSRVPGQTAPTDSNSAASEHHQEHHAWRILDIHAHSADTQDRKRRRATTASVTTGAAPTAPATGQHAQHVQQQAQYQRVSEAPPSGHDVEALLKSVFMPMLDDYLATNSQSIMDLQPTAPQPQPSTHYKLPSRRGQAPPHAPNTPTGPAPDALQQAAAAGAGTAQAMDPAQVEGHGSGTLAVASDGAAAGADREAEMGDSTGVIGDGEESGEEELVYDVYVEVEEEEAGEAEGQDPGACVYEPGSTEGLVRIPIIEVPDSDDDELWAAQGDVAGLYPGLYDKPAGDYLGDDDEDSNAESYYANTYPDEDNDHDDLSDDMNDDWGGHRRQEHRRGGHGGYDDEEYDLDQYDSDEELEEQYDGVTRSRRAAQGLLRAALAAQQQELKGMGKGKGAQQGGSAVDMDL